MNNEPEEYKRGTRHGYDARLQDGYATPPPPNKFRCPACGRVYEHTEIGRNPISEDGTESEVRYERPVLYFVCECKEILEPKIYQANVCQELRK